MVSLFNLVRAKGDPKVLQSGRSSMDSADRLARGLGWFSIGLGLAELLAPRRIARMLGLYGQAHVVRAYGVREIGAGILTLSTEKDMGLWSRVTGDVLDAVTLLPAIGRSNPRQRNARLALTMVMGVLVLDVLAAQAVSARQKRRPGTLRDYSNRSGFPRGLPHHSPERILPAAEVAALGS
jgi:hypothetical protein